MFLNIKKSLAVVALTLITQLSAASSLVNINTADAATIAENLNGIGVSKARAIIEYRDLHGEFRDAEDLVKVKGIGFKLVERNSALISFDTTVSTPSTVTDGSGKLPATEVAGEGAAVPAN